ncbi:winged helix-turn-helix domain-containing protein [Oerskovia sp. M15]
MAELLILTPATGGSVEVLPALGLLSHRIRVLPMEPSALVDAPDSDVLLLDARRDLAAARTTCRLLRATGLSVPLVLVLTEGGLTVVTAEWGADDLLLEHAGPAEVEARLRLVIERSSQGTPTTHPRRSRRRARDRRGRLHGQAARTTSRPHLQGVRAPQVPRAAPGPRLHTRPAAPGGLGLRLLRGTRTVDVHVRRLRAKLGPEHEQLIGTVRNVGYRFDPPKDRRATAQELEAPAIVVGESVPTGEQVSSSG